MPAPVECGREDLNLQQQPSQDCASAVAPRPQDASGEIQTRNLRLSETCALFSYRATDADDFK
jgi:hypothetical protein